ncbi:MAG: hypothetical protein LQ343_007748 [Gyalolechia ehrenbergii]|nr:MAG: hypothetical protein LQ343_007748 [Gyalolechia ehrenbergii]
MEDTFEQDDTSDFSLEAFSNGSLENSPPASPAWPTVSDVHRALRPLQATADRVGKQVEEFAETLDRLSKYRRETSEADCTHALTLVDGYRKIAGDTVEYLRAIHTPEKQKRLYQKPNEKTRGCASSPDIQRRRSKDLDSYTTVEDLEKWQQEEQTWHLLGLMLQVEYPSSELRTKRTSLNERLVRPSKESGIHPYSSENEVWSHFLAHDDQAWERHTVVEWLRICADGSGREIEQVVQDIEVSADRGTGLWAHSWLYTKEAIKGQKRLRSWPQALAADSPGIDTSLRSSDRTKSLVTQLDPDAVTRQGRGLEPQDESFERATWLACWEMIRRGKDWNFIRAECQERVEHWRAIAMRGDHRQHTLKSNKSFQDPGLAVNWQSRVLWRKICALAARTGEMTKYEAAVYGVLSGYLPSVQNVCESWNDYLFAHYNSYLLRSFDQYIATNLADRLPRGFQDPDGPFEFSMTGGRRTQSGNQLIEKMRRVKHLAKEAKDPMKRLQGSLIGKTFDSFVLRHGFQLLRVKSREKKEFNSNKETAQTDVEENKELLVKPDDYQLIRIITHIALIYQKLGRSWKGNKYRRTTEAFVDAYIDFLGKAGKQQLLPLYASRMSPDTAVVSLSRQLPLVVEYGERRTMMELMKQYEIDVPRALNAQLLIVMDDIGVKEERSMDDPKYPPLSILAPPGEQNKGEMRSIRDGFMGNTISDDQHDLINAFEWYLLLDGYWEKTLATGAVLYKCFLKHPASKGLGAAKELSRRVTFSNLSRKKTKAILGREADISNIHDDEEPFAGGRSSGTSRVEDYDRRGDQFVTQKGHSEVERYLYWQSNSFLNFEQLLNVLTAFEEWQAAMAKKPERTDLGGRSGKQWRDEVRVSCEHIVAKIQPLLHGWLKYPRNDEEASEFERIREACLPEVLLAYVAALNSSAQYVSRELLLKSLDLGAAVASKDSDVATCFVSTGRMPELVDILAFTSTNMLLAGELGGGKKRASTKLSLWSGRGSSGAVT